MIIDGNFYIGDSSVSRLYQGAHLVYDSSHPDILLQYIANGPDDGTGTPNVYFDTGFTPQLSTKAEIKFETASVAAGRLFGCGNATNGATQYWLNMYAAGNTQEGTANTSFKFAYRGQDIAASITPEANTQYTVTLFGTYSGNTASEVNMTVNGTTYSRTRSITSNISSASSAYIFAAHGSSPEGPNSNSGVKVYYLKMWSDNNLVRFYIPVLHWYNGQYVPCFYDKVNDTYIYNLGTDTPTYKMSEDYLLDYIGSGPENAIPDNRQVAMRYDSGVVASNQLQTDMRGRLVWGRENYLFGSATSGQTTPTWQPYGYCTVGGSTDADKMRLRMGMGASSTSNYGMYLSTDASTVVGVNTLSAYFDASRGYVYLNGTRSNTSSPVPDTFSSNTIHLFSRHGDATNINALGGSRIYFINFTISNVPTKTFIPVLHNGQAEFLDLNSGTYIYNIGTATPYYILKS